LIKIGLFAIIMVMLTGCGLWSTAQEQWQAIEELVPGYDHPEEEAAIQKSKPTKLFDVDQKVSLVKLWSSSVVGSYDAVGFGLRPVFSEDKIYVADKNGLVVSLDAISGKTIWKVDLDLPLGGGVGIGGEQVFVGSEDGDIIALNADNGAVIWQVKTSSEILSAPSGNGDIVVAQSQDGRIYGLDAQNGEIRWQHEVEVPILTLRGTSTPVVKGNIVIAGFSTGKLYVFAAATGDTIWEHRIGIPKGRSELDKMVDIDGDPLLIGDTVYAASHQGRVAAIDKTGRALWYQDTSSVLSPAYGEGHIYIVKTSDKIVAMDEASGAISWVNASLKYRDLGPPLIIGGYLLVADYEGYIHVLSQEEGDFLGRARVDRRGISAPMIENEDILYVLDNDGAVSAYKLK
jgi:outer membrane protein assembly factor BamB|tara:strand:+ start:1191 stop:2396 length:1206 start_codon:yes stop_codon:yes gene_type:complete